MTSPSCARRAATLGSHFGGNKRSMGSIRNRRLERRRATNSTTPARRPTAPATKPRSRANGSSPCSALRQSRSTNWPGPRRLQRGWCGWRCSNSKWRGASNIRATASHCEGPPTKFEPNGSSIERIARVGQSNRNLEGGLLVRALGFRDGVGANIDFAFRSRHSEEISEQVEAGSDRHGLELGGHVCDVASDIERFVGDSPIRRIAGLSERSPGTVSSGSHLFSTHSSRETDFLNHKTTLSRSAEGGGPFRAPRSGVESPAQREGRFDSGSKLVYTVTTLILDRKTRRS